jgi:hypothetical protein
MLIYIIFPFKFHFQIVPSISHFFLLFSIHLISMLHGIAEGMCSYDKFALETWGYLDVYVLSPPNLCTNKEFFWDITLRSPLKVNRRFGGTYFRLQG